MNRVLLTMFLVGASASAFAVDEIARVVSVAPVTQQVGVPRTACATYAAPGVPPQCSTQTIHESRTVAYHVVYEHAGKQFSVQLPQNPGPTLRLQVAVASASVPMPAMSAASPASAANVIVEAPAMADEAMYEVVPFPAPVQVSYGVPGYVSYYGSPYYSAWGPVVTLGLVGGYFGGRYYGGRGHGWHGHGWHGHRR
jgi:hypothetical protein